jgi:hypothetical protein
MFNLFDMTDDELEAAWVDLHESTPPGWFVGRPLCNERRDEWSMYAFDTTERLKVGHRSREWSSVAPTQARVVHEMARCLRKLEAGRVPK